VNHGKLEEECVGIHATIDALEREKAEAVAARKAEVTTMHKKNSRLSCLSPQEVS
jgi:hypothetical protein